MFFNKRYTTTGGIKFSVFFQDNHGYDPRNIKVHALISPNLDSWDYVIAHEIRDFLQSKLTACETVACTHDIRVQVFSPRHVYRRSGQAAFFITLHGKNDIVSYLDKE